jgi:hypothetical protein
MARLDQVRFVEAALAGRKDLQNGMLERRVIAAVFFLNEVNRQKS